MPESLREYQLCDQSGLLSVGSCEASQWFVPPPTELFPGRSHVPYFVLPRTAQFPAKQVDLVHLENRTLGLRRLNQALTSDAQACLSPRVILAISGSRCMMSCRLASESWTCKGTPLASVTTHGNRTLA